MGVHFDPLYFVIRGGNEFKEYGDPYTAIGFGSVERDRTFCLGGLTGDINHSMLREVFDTAKVLSQQFNWKEIIYERRRPSGLHIGRIKVT